MIDQFELAIGGGDPLSFKFSDADGRDTVALDAKRSGLVYYEVPFPTVLGALMRLSDGDFYDVGANTGIFSLLAAAANPKISVHSFEPVPYIGKLLDENIRINPKLSARINPHPVALSNRDGSFTMMEHINPTGHVSTSSSLETTHLEGNVEHRNISVDVTTLDSWMQSQPDSLPAVIKVDVEGHERAFFDGARATIRRYRPFLIVELLGGIDEAHFAIFLDEHRYSDLALFPGSATLQERPVFLPAAWNHLFCPQEQLWRLAILCNEIGLPIG